MAGGSEDGESEVAKGSKKVETGKHPAWMLSLVLSVTQYVFFID